MRHAIAATVILGVAGATGANAQAFQTHRSVDQPKAQFDARSASDPAGMPVDGRDVVAFWREAGQALWFAKDDAFDRRFRDRFISSYELAARGKLDAWLATPEGSLALVILLDQFPRNAFRGSPRMYATDERARHVAAKALAAGHDTGVEPALRLFLYLPFGHSESLADQETSVSLAEKLGEPNLTHARHHHDIIRRFGRFPHRNAILGRAMTDEEQAYLDQGGYKG